MAKKDVKVKDLAKELGVTSRDIIDRCRAEGIQVQNSITKLPPERARLVRSWFSAKAQRDPVPPKPGCGGNGPSSEYSL